MCWLVWLAGAVFAAILVLALYSCLRISSEADDLEEWRRSENLHNKKEDDNGGL